MTKTYACARCDGSGRINAFSHVLGGVCFRCGGSGRVAPKPRVSVLWHVSFRDRATRSLDLIYAVNARTEAGARRKVAQTYARASDDFRAQYALEEAEITLRGN